MSIDGAKVAFLVAPEGVEQVELTRPWSEVEAAGGAPSLLSTRSGEIQAYNHLDKADTFAVDAIVDEVGVDDFDVLVLPGGVANPDKLRMHDGAVALTRAFLDAGKPVASICHGPWTLVEADGVRGRTLTSYPSLETDIRNAGGTWIDVEVNVCRDGAGPLITSRRPDDLDAFCRETIAAIEQARVNV